MIASSSEPVLLLDGDLKVLAASTSFRQAFRLDEDPAGRRIFETGSGEWDKPQLKSLLEATVSGFAEIESYEMDLKIRRQGTRKLVLHARRLDYGDPEHVRLLLTATDVTDARASEKARTTSCGDASCCRRCSTPRATRCSLASVLMQSARKVHSKRSGPTCRRQEPVDVHRRPSSALAPRASPVELGPTSPPLQDHLPSIVTTPRS